jgi:hypothetical protein
MVRTTDAGGEQTVAVEQTGQGDAAQAAAQLPEELAPVGEHRSLAKPPPEGGR